MEQPFKINSVISDLSDFLNKNEYFPNKDSYLINQEIEQAWTIPLREAISTDLIAKFKTLHVEFILSVFELTPENESGSPSLYLHNISIIDKKHSENLLVFVKTIFPPLKTVVYLDSKYAILDKWSGKSSILKSIFKELKKADAKAGYFNPLLFQELLSKTAANKWFAAIRG